LIFQTLDDKSDCVGIYVDGQLHFDHIPANLTKTWRYTPSITDSSVEYAWLYVNGKTLEDACSQEQKEDVSRIQRTFRAYLKSFQLGRINLREHCFYDLVPHDFLTEFCEIKNKVTQHVFDNYERPANYDHLASIERLLYKIKYQNLNFDSSKARNLFVGYNTRTKAREFMNGPKHIDYNLFGTVTGRLTTKTGSCPILTMKKDFRALIRPHNRWFLSLDYNGAEARTVLGLLGVDQPEKDIHEWNMENIFRDRKIDREAAKVKFFAWLYDYNSDSTAAGVYDREKLLDKWYKDGYISTPMNRHIKIDERRSFNYLIQSTTSDLVLGRAVAIDELLANKKSFISHIVHDEIVVDLAEEDRYLVPEIQEAFSVNKLGSFKVNLNIGENYLDFTRLDI